MVKTKIMQLTNILIILLNSFVIVICNNEFILAKVNHKSKNLTSEHLKYLANLSDRNHLNRAIDNILIPRVVGTENHEKVFNYLVNELRKYEWNVEVDEFVEKTPIFGSLKFKNIVATLNPSAERYLVLACHYDSKYFENIEFVGAIDSAVPCAMILNLIKVMNDDLKELNESLSLKLIFFDGEEAFENWGPNDSIYGAKHLARKFHTTKTVSKKYNSNLSDLQRIDLLVLLDLIGMSNPNFYSFHENTEKWYVCLARAERNLAKLNLLNNYNQNYFHLIKQYANIEDDHTPFLKKNVPILHLITVPFPHEWHTENDNRNIIDLETTENINKILRVFVTEYLHLLEMDPKTTTNDEINFNKSEL